MLSMYISRVQRKLNNERTSAAKDKSSWYCVEEKHF